MTHERTNDSRRIIIIDDNPHIFRDFQTVLADKPDTSALDLLEAEFFGESTGQPTRRIPYDLNYAAQGEEGVGKIKTALLENRPYALAFVDMRMPPGWDGLETITRLWEADPAVQVVLCTAYSDYSWEAITERVGKTDKLLILKKPFDPAEVAQLASALTEKWMLARQASLKISEIEERVEDRTRELERAIKKLRQEIDERKTAEKALQESEKRYRMLFEKAGDAIFILQDEVIKFANPGTLNILEYPLDELSRIPFTDIIHDEDRSKVFDLYTKKLQGQVIPEYYFFRAVSRDGRELWLQNSAIRITWEGRPATLNISRDITRLKKMENQFIQLQKMDAIGTLAGGIAHDFNNILSAIMGYTQLSLVDAAGNSKLSHKLERVLQASHRAKELIDQILTFSRQEELKKEPVQVRLIVREVLKLLRASIPSNIEFKLDIPKETGVIHADPIQIHQVLMNLCGNAAHAMAEKGGALSIRLSNLDIGPDEAREVSDVPPGPYVLLSVTDTGHGMDKHTVDKIFNPYFTTKEPGDGTGLGLSVVHGIIRDMGGLIKVSSEKGRGTTFELYIPRVDINANRVESIKKAPPTGTESILIVDDEEFILDLFKVMLVSLGYSVTARTSSIEALNAFQATPDRFDLVITDQTMPNMTGEILAEKMLAARPDIPVILCTGFSAVMSAEKAHAIGIRAFLKKPVLKDELAETIRSILDQSAESTRQYATAK